ncbi:MAG: Smr/MutS family protein [Syntrophobacteraceae bacterium]
MSKRKGDTQKSSRRDIRQESLPGFYTPFKDLDQHLTPNFSNQRKQPVPSEKKPERKKPQPTEPLAEGDDEILFKKAMADVNPLPGEVQSKVPLRPPERKYPRFLEQEELESYTQLVDLVAGDGPFELSSSDEYTDGAVLGISPEVLKKLREGYFSYQDHLDLHGLNRQEARGEVTAFIMESFVLRRRCVLIIPGRGLNSKDKEPVLKNNLVAWLTRAPLKRAVLAFASARSYDGGWGAFYVLLRKNEGKAPLITPAP